jgi:hypothetical protein
VTQIEFALDPHDTPLYVGGPSTARSTKMQ